MEKRAMMDNFDDAVCDDRLRLEAVTEHCVSLDRDELFDGEFRVVATSGTSGVRGYFCFDREGWRSNLAAYLRVTLALGTRPRLPRWRFAQLTATGPLHLTYRFATVADVGAYRVLRVDVSEPLGRLVEELNRFQPDVITGYPSVLAALADEQRAGRLDVAPMACLVTAEQCTVDMRRRIERAWSIQPFNAYATTETGGILALECEAHHGMHILEDRVLVEVVDSGGDPVPDGERGASVLMTNLDNLAQPIIRYRLDDVLTLDSSQCPCGRTTRRIVSVEGRVREYLELEGTNGTPVSVHPSRLLELVGEQPWIAEWQVAWSPDHLDIVVTRREGVEPDMALFAEKLGQALRDLGAEPPTIRITPVSRIPRGPGGKQVLIRRTKAGGERAADSSIGPSRKKAAPR